MLACFQKDGLHIFDTEELRHGSMPFRFAAGGAKGSGCKAPFFLAREGGKKAPKGPNKAEDQACLQYFLVLRKSQKGASPQHLKRPRLRVFFSLQAEKTSILTGLWGLERATRDPKRKKQPALHLHFCWFFASWVKGFRGERILG